MKRLLVQEYNICFTTVERRALAGQVTSEGDLSLPELPDPSLQPGILPTQVRSQPWGIREVGSVMRCKCKKIRRIKL